MDGAHDPLKPVNWVKPGDIKTLPAYVLRNKISSQSEIVPSPSTDLFPSWYKQKSSGSSGSQTIDKVSGKLATSCTPDAAKETQGGSNVNAFSVDIFMGKNSSSSSTADTTAQDDVHNCNDAKPQVSLTAPANCNTSCSFTANVTQGTHALSSDQYPGTVELYINGQKVQSQNISNSGAVSFNYNPTSAGSFSAEVRVTDSVLYTASESATVTGGP
jgi:hypothetical protein